MAHFEAWDPVCPHGPPRGMWPCLSAWPTFWHVTLFAALGRSTSSLVTCLLPGAMPPLALSPKLCLGKSECVVLYMLVEMVNPSQQVECHTLSHILVCRNKPLCTHGPARARNKP
eukprot:1152002-Pelagomonas_calceolata.AAC.1